MIENSPDNIIRYDRNARAVYLNPALEKTLGVTAAAILGKKPSESVPGSREMRTYQEKIEDVLRTGETAEFELICAPPHGNGKPICDSIRLIPERDPSGEVVGVLTVGRNISAIKATERQLRTLVENLPDMIAHFDPEGRFIFVSPNLAKMFGLSRERFIGKTIDEIFPGAMTPDKPLVDYIKQAVEQCEASTCEVRWSLPEGERLLDIRHIPELDEHGKAVSVLSIARDITEHKRAEAVLVHYAEIIESSQDAIIGKTLDGTITSWNRGAERLFGYRDDEVLGKPIAVLIPDDYLADERMILEQVRRGQSVKHYETVRRHKDGRLIDISVTVSPLKDASGSIIGASKIARDITEHKRAEAKLRLAANVFANSYEGIMITDADHLIVDVNPAFTRITGYAKEEVVGKSPKILASGIQGPAFYSGLRKSLQEHDLWRGEIWNRRKSGELYAEMLSIAAVRDDAGKLQHYIGVFSDISLLKQHEAELERIAHFDSLTGVPNRRLLADRLGQAIAQSGVAARRWPSATSTWTASSRSTTDSAMPRVTIC